ncbi:hypothetical protein F4861DRAFT_456348 [Xylaria intraflava]|nr:hypothetical protein F4861DRAFT_456348 [Xylaria intraflava]
MYTTPADRLAPSSLECGGFGGVSIFDRRELFREKSTDTEYGRFGRFRRRRRRHHRHHHHHHHYHHHHHHHQHHYHRHPHHPTHHLHRLHRNPDGGSTTPQARWSWSYQCFACTSRSRKPSFSGCQWLGFTVFIRMRANGEFELVRISRGVVTCRYVCAIEDRPLGSSLCNGGIGSGSSKVGVIRSLSFVVCRLSLSSLFLPLECLAYLLTMLLSLLVCVSVPAASLPAIASLPLLYGSYNVHACVAAVPSKRLSPGP